jgi:hypothetical protein
MAYKTILLDIDGVLVTTPGWKRVELLKDGFLEFNKRATDNLIKLLSSAATEIILTTSHRKNYSLPQWKDILEARGIPVNDLKKIDESEALHTKSRADEIIDWIKMYGNGKNYVIIDDDSSLDNLPLRYKNKWVKTKPLIGLDDEATNKALHILNGD